MLTAFKLWTKNKLHFHFLKKNYNIFQQDRGKLVFTNTSIRQIKITVTIPKENKLGKKGIQYTRYTIQFNPFGKKNNNSFLSFLKEKNGINGKPIFINIYCQTWARLARTK